MDPKSDFGEVITVIDEKPIKFEVKRIKHEATSFDKTRRWPVSYVFEPTQSHQDIKYVHNFAVKVKDDLVSSLFDGKEDHPSLHSLAILYGLNCIKPYNNQDTIDLDKANYEKVYNEQWIESKTLTDAIRKFCYDINKEWQMQGISHFDILDNFFTDRSHVSNSMRYLVREQTIEPLGSKPFRKNRAPASTETYHINPLKFQEIENRFKPQVKSIDHIDPYKHYKIIPIDADKLTDRFIFYMMQFDDANLKRFLILKEFCKEQMNLEIIISKEDNRPNNLNNTIVSHIHKCKFGIADLTSQNPNVMYELGFAHAINKEIILISDKNSVNKKRIFDIDNINTIHFSDIEYLFGELKKQIPAVLSALTEK